MPDLGRGRTRGRGDRGGVLTEAAVLTPVLLLIVFAAFDLGLAYHDFVATSDAVRSAGRSASVLGDNAMADHDVLQDIGEDLEGAIGVDVERVVIWLADGPNDTMPLTCSVALPGAGTTDACNVYGPQHFDDDEDQFGCVATVDAPTPPDRFWCPTDRVTSIEAGSDYLGIQIDAVRPYVTGLFGASTDFSASTIVRLEPEDDE